MVLLFLPFLPLRVYRSPSLPLPDHKRFLTSQQRQEFSLCIVDGTAETPQGGKESKLEKKPQLSNIVG